MKLDCIPAKAIPGFVINSVRVSCSAPVIVIAVLPEYATDPTEISEPPVMNPTGELPAKPVVNKFAYAYDSIIEMMLAALGPLRVRFFLRRAMPHSGSLAVNNPLSSLSTNLAGFFAILS